MATRIEFDNGFDNCVEKGYEYDSGLAIISPTIPPEQVIEKERKFDKGAEATSATDNGFEKEERESEK